MLVDEMLIISLRKVVVDLCDIDTEGVEANEVLNGVIKETESVCFHDTL